MNRIRFSGARLVSASLLALALLLPGTAAADEQVAEVYVDDNVIAFYPLVEGQLVFHVTGPCNYDFRKVYREGETPKWYLSEETIDGVYRYTLKAIPKVPGAIIEVLKRARELDDNSEVNELCREGKMPGDPLTQSHGFVVLEGRIAWKPGSLEEGFGGDLDGGFSSIDGNSYSGDSLQHGIPTKDFVINDDLIVDGSACIGFDCVDGESFGFDTIRVKENNLRIKFDDTSTAASYPRNDWQLTANDSANGGASKFSIDDISGNRTPFTVEANARSHSLYVDDGGRIGSRTSTPSTEIHTIDGDTPT
ncbi:MAG: hypothetical protein GY719_09860, partial [bacterium]|nr:hypothetical protein [bacterium]